MDSPPQSKADRLTRTKQTVIARSVDWIRSFFPNLRDAGIRWNEDDAGSLAASVAYYLALSLFPMMLLLSSGVGIFLQFSHSGQNAEQQILSTVETYASPVIRDQIEQVLKQLRSHSLVSGPFGILTAVLAAIGVFSQIDRGFDRIFRIPPSKDASVTHTIFRVLHHRFFSFLMLLCLGGMILLLFVASVIIAQLRSITGSTLPSMMHVFGAFELCFAVLANAMLFALMFRWLPKRRVQWLDAIRGGLLTAAIWEVGRGLLGVFLIGMRYTTAYGVIGSFIALLLWCYYGISIIFFGAEYVQVLQLRRTGKATTEHEAHEQEVASEGHLESEQSDDSDSDSEESAESEDTMRGADTGRLLQLQSSGERSRPRRSS